MTTEKSVEQTNMEHVVLDECAICGDELLPGSDIYKLSCNHCYHKECIMLEFGSTKKGNYKCPYCRTQIKNVPLFEKQIPISGIHQEYKKYAGKVIPYSEFKQFLDTSSNTNRCQALLYTQDTIKDGQKCFKIFNDTRQCARKKLKNGQFCCSQHNKKYNNYDFNNAIYKFP